MLMARFYAEVEYLIPFFYEDGTQDGYQVCEDVEKIEADSISEMAEKLYTMSDKIHSVCVWAKNSKDTYGEIFFIDIDIDIKDKNEIFDALCNGVANAMKYEKNFRELLIHY